MPGCLSKRFIRILIVFGGAGRSCCGSLALVPAPARIIWGGICPGNAECRVTSFVLNEKMNLAASGSPNNSAGNASRVHFCYPGTKSTHTAANCAFKSRICEMQLCTRGTHGGLFRNFRLNCPEFSRRILQDAETICVVGNRDLHGE